MGKAFYALNIAARVARLVVLGSAGSAPWAGRNLPGFLVDNVLLDCGEGVARALAEVGVIDDVEYVFITHMHGDHVSGLPMLLWYYALSGRSRALTLAIPRGCRGELETLLKSMHSPMERISSFLKIRELDGGARLGPVTASPAMHSVPALAYRVSTEEGDVCYTGDTSPSRNIVELANGCRILIHEATIPPGREEEARALGHSTPLQAGEIAEEAGVDVLILVHLPYFYFRSEHFISSFVSAAERVFKGKVLVPKEPLVLPP